MENNNWFESWFNSPYYKVLYQNRDITEAEDFTDVLLQFLRPPGAARFLDIGCGEGRFAVQFANQGFDVTGIDLATNRIDKARQLESELLHFFVHDMRQPFYVNYFDYAFNLFTSFGYFDTERDNFKAAKAFASGLKQGGILILDYLNKHWVLQQLQAFQIVEKQGIRFDIQKDFDGKHIIKHIRFIDEQGEARHYTERVWAYGLDDFRQLFDKAGLRMIHTFGDYQLSPFDEQRSERMIMLFQK